MDLKRQLFISMLCILALLLATQTLADTQKLYLDLLQGTVINGKNITFIGISGENVNLQVDGVFGSIPKGSAKKVGGVLINVVGLSKKPPIAIIEVTVNFVCGDGTCNSANDEDYSTCCKDCGCLSASKACINNICVENITLPGATYECLQDSDCPSTNKSCVPTICDISFIPHKCVTKTITQCQQGDNCCPKSCTIQTDPDCLSVDSCKTDADCTDTNPCTLDRCWGKPLHCTNEDSGGCQVNQGCIPLGETRDIKYCDSSGVMKFLKENKAPCSNDYECLSKHCRTTCTSGITSTLSHLALWMVISIVILFIIFYIYAAIKKKKE